MTQGHLQSHSPPNSPDEESDRDSPGVYFGAFETSEKQFVGIPVVPHLASSSPPVRLSDQKPSSPALSISTCSDDFIDVERLAGLVEEWEEIGVGYRTEGADLPDDDEPSAVLASKLLCALDNPSPPPCPALSIHDEMEGAQADKPEEGIDSLGEHDVLSSALVNLPRESQFISSISSSSSEPDLMTFDCADDLSKQIDYPGISLPVGDVIQDPPSPFTFPDSLAIQVSENSQMIESFQGNTDILVDVEDGNSVLGNTPPLVMECDRKANSFERIHTTHTRGPSLSPMNSPKIASRSFEAHTAENLPYTPLRRSLRPRKSPTPHLLKYLAVSSSSSCHSTPTLEQEPKGKKGKERAMTPLNGTVTITAREENDLRGGPSRYDEESSGRKTQRRYSRSPTRRGFTQGPGILSASLNHPIPSDLPTNQPSHTKNAGIFEQASTVHNSPCEVQTVLSVSQRVHVLSASEFVDQNFPTPTRIPISPRGSHVLSKTLLQPVFMDDPSRTLARRIPLVEQGHISPHKLSQTGTPALFSFNGQTGPVLNTQLKGDTSPARRIFNTSSTGHEAVPESRNLLKHCSVEPFTRLPTYATSMSASQKVLPTSRSTRLPFPLVAPVRMQPISENCGCSGSTILAKSALKQTTSRIPRSKPYSKSQAVPTLHRGEHRTERRPETKAPTNHAGDILSTEVDSYRKSRKSTNVVNPTRAVVNARSNGTTTVSTRVIRAVDLSKSSRKNQSGQALTLSPLNATTSLTSPRTVPLVGGLKRKRLDFKNRSVNSSRSITLREVHGPATYTMGVSHPTAVPPQKASRPPSRSRSQSQTMQKPNVVKSRRVMPFNQSLSPSPHILEERRPTPVISPPPEHGSSSPSDREPTGSVSDEDIALSSPVGEIILHSLRSSPSIMIPLPPSPPLPLPAPLVFLIDPLSPVSQIEAASSSSVVEAKSQGTSTRRIVRRKTSQAKPGTVMFGSDPNNITNINSLQRRRTSTSAGLNADDVLSGMNMNALKILTADNTMRNQYYAVAMLETQLVRKDGVRPESPVVKVKTISQRQQEEKVRQREERAARRARRHRNSLGDQENNDRRSKETDLTSDVGDLHSWKPHVKHQKGAGDEEDYETPLRNIDGAAIGERRVKWDKGLFTEVFLDEVILGSKAPLKEHIPTKGCLTQSAKTLQLDDLGNLMEQDNPCSLVQENVVVKKFVYDDEVELTPEPVSPVVRNTRSRSKKNKT